jgi:hypothetical protein
MAHLGAGRLKKDYNIFQRINYPILLFRECESSDVSKDAEKVGKIHGIHGASPRAGYLKSSYFLQISSVISFRLKK